MRDFPPQITAYPPSAHQTPTTAPQASRRAAAEPDTRSPAAFLRWSLWQQWPVILASLATGVLWQLPLTVGPWMFGRAVDEGILGGSATATAWWATLLMLVTVVGVIFGIALHTLVVRGWLIAFYGTTALVTRKAIQLGHILPRRAPTGEVFSVASSDSDEFGALSEIIARAGSQLIAFLTVAAIVVSIDLRLGLVVLAAAPVLVGIALPLLRPLHRRQQIERSRNSELTSQATDIVAGLRILRGIGGERTFGRNYRTQSQRAKAAGVSAGLWQAATEAVGVLFSGLFIVTLVWLGTRAVEAGDITVGQLVTFLGYALFMIGPIQTFFEFAQKLTRSLVSARKAIGIFDQATPWIRPARPVLLGADGDLVDDASGFVAHPGQLTVVVSAVPEDSSALADRLGRYLSANTDPEPLDAGDELKGRAARRVREARAQQRSEIAALDSRIAAQAWRVRLGDVDLADADLDDVRRTIVVSDTGSQLFAGTLQEAIDPQSVLSRAQAEEAVRIASAEDVYDALPGGWQGQIDERGRGLSGGQRQRVVLARVIAREPSILILVEPTSAVDAHTEARIAQRVAAHRRGRTTIVTTVSPLWLHHADRVVLLGAGEVIASGTHSELVETSPAYRAVVTRDLDTTNLTDGGWIADD